jgi:TPR repeat protein
MFKKFLVLCLLLMNFVQLPAENNTTQSRLESMASTAEGCLLFFGWEDAAKYNYEVSILTQEQKKQYIEYGLKLVEYTIDDVSLKDSHVFLIELLVNYYLSINERKKALFWAFEGAEKGSSHCMFVLADAYKNGKGVIQDLEEGIKWIFLAAAAGDEACSRWVQENGHKYLTNESVAPIIKESKKRANMWMKDHPEIFISS